MVGAAILGMFEVVFFAAVGLPLIRQSIEDGLKQVGQHVSLPVQGKPAVETAIEREQEDMNTIFQNALAVGIAGCLALVAIAIVLAVIMRRRKISIVPPTVTLLITIPVMAFFQLTFFLRMQQSYEEMGTPELIHTFFGGTCST
jgi:heme/copper-type cytochrome/quinol oxidase subunit 4